MVLEIARKESLGLIRDGRFRLVCCTLALLLGVASFTGFRDYRQRADAQAAFAKSERERWLGQGVTSPHTAAHHGVYAFKPQGPLAALDFGVDRWAGSVVYLEAHSNNFLRHSPAEDGAPVRRFGELSVAAMLEILVPLLLALLTYDSFAGERESGTLRLVLAQGVRRKDLVLGKILGIALPIACVMLPAAALGAAAMFWWARSGQNDVVRYATIASGYFLYFLLLLGVFLSVSMLTKSTRMALCASLALWFWNSVAASQVGTDIARWIAPAPEPLEVSASVTEQIARRATLWERRREVNERLKRQYNVTSILQLPVNPGGVLLLEQEADDTRATSENVKRVYEAQGRQESVYRWGGFAAPLLALRPVTMGLAGTDLYHYHHFASAAEQYRRQFVLMMNEASTYDQNIRGKEVHPRVEAVVSVAGPDLWAKVPEFRYQAPQTADILRHNDVSLALFAAWFVAIPLLLMYSSRRWGLV